MKKQRLRLMIDAGVMAVVIVRVRLSGQERSLGVDEDKVAEEIRFDVPFSEEFLIAAETGLAGREERDRARP